ncbi:uncharacterized protein KY384_006196 [Bacidia gigantensis]|uniref:uncharacterized protein n=1 Tax=Bacidia gigantensis TaxID=2732470 RepID=UPI001D057992|nr:uncharacterized protein KY384_006196 [Bacidia gigantensis]KAG8529559.1 hypothetical protein KY384_006196 [Bacidia gigantensis]
MFPKINILSRHPQSTQEKEVVKGNPEKMMDSTSSHFPSFPPHTSRHPHPPVQSIFEAKTDTMASVNLNLIAVGSTREEIGDRFITLNKNVPYVAVGRSSKNPVKGLEPCRKNAIFDCPIMSRDHARFEMVETPMSIVVKDLGSTHGTFLRKERLEAHKPYTLGSGEDISFGVEVTNGPQVHSAKTFRVFYSAKMNNQIPPSLPRGFRAPEYESASGSDDSREASIQILEKTTHQYSLCSSDEDSDSDYGYSDSEEDREVFDKVTEQVSAVTTPDSKQPRSEEQHKSNNDHIADLIYNSDRMATPPRSDEQTEATQSCQPEVHDITSEDGDNNDLPQEEDPVATSTSRPSPTIRPQNPLSAVLNEKSDSFKENIAPEPRTVPETQPQDVMTEEEEDTDFDIECSESDYGSSEHESVDIPCSPKGKANATYLHPQEPFKSPQAPEKKPHNPLYGDSFYRRSPSPSDAAIPQRNFGPSVKNNTPFSWQQQGFGLGPFNSSYVNKNESCIQYPDSWNTFGQPYAPFPGHLSQVQQYAYPSEMTSLTPLISGPVTHPSQGLSFDTCSWEDPYRSGPFQRRKEATPKTDESNKAHEVNASAANHGEALRKESSQSQFPRLHISDIINESHSVNGTPERPLKRKAAMITQDPVEKEPSPDPSSIAVSEQDQVPETVIPETILPEAQDHNMNLDQANENINLLLESTMESINSIQPERHEVATENQPPPRKRSRTSSSTIGGIAKYMTAAAVGAIGVLAAIVATAPSSIQEEAMREMMM